MDRRGEQITVCLLTYNHVELIESTIASILRQTLSGYEVVVSDDCSTDGTWERIVDLSAADARLKPVRTPRNLGMPGNANFAIAQSPRPFVALLHHDDLYREDLLERWLRVMEAHPDVGFVFNPYGVHESEHIFTNPFASERMDGRWFLEKHLLPRWGCPVRGTAMIRRSAWEKVGGMREQFGLLADVDLWMRLAAIAAVGHVAEPVITIRHARPDYYPDIYKGDKWSWQRQCYLYDLHAANRRATPGGKIPSWVEWRRFRLRVSLETAKWLSYALVRRRHDMLATCADSETEYDQIWLRLYRRLVRTWCGLRADRAL